MIRHIKEDINTLSLCNIPVNKNTTQIAITNDKHLCADCYGILLLKGLKLSKVYIGSDRSHFCVTPDGFSAVSE